MRGLLVTLATALTASLTAIAVVFAIDVQAVNLASALAVATCTFSAGCLAEVAFRTPAARATATFCGGIFGSLVTLVARGVAGQLLPAIYVDPVAMLIGLVVALAVSLAMGAAVEGFDDVPPAEAIGLGVTVAAAALLAQVATAASARLGAALWPLPWFGPAGAWTLAHPTGAAAAWNAEHALPFLRAVDNSAALVVATVTSAIAPVVAVPFAMMLGRNFINAVRVREALGPARLVPAALAAAGAAALPASFVALWAVDVVAGAIDGQALWAHLEVGFALACAVLLASFVAWVLVAGIGASRLLGRLRVPDPVFEPAPKRAPPPPKPSPAQARHEAPHTGAHGHAPAHDGRRTPHEPGTSRPARASVARSAEVRMTTDEASRQARHGCAVQFLAFSAAAIGIVAMLWILLPVVGAGAAAENKVPALVAIGIFGVLAFSVLTWGIRRLRAPMRQGQVASSLFLDALDGAPAGTGLGYVDRSMALMIGGLAATTLSAMLVPIAQLLAFRGIGSQAFMDQSAELVLVIYLAGAYLLSALAAPAAAWYVRWMAAAPAAGPVPTVVVPPNWAHDMEKLHEEGRDRNPPAPDPAADAQAPRRRRRRR